MSVDEPEVINHATLLQRVKAGAVSGARVIGQPGGWRVVVKDGQIERALCARGGSPRRFRRFETLVGYLKNIGLEQFEVDATLYPSREAPHPQSISPKLTPDEVVEHGRWFREEIAQTLEGVDRGEVRLLSDDEHRARWATMQADLLRRSRRRG